MNQLNGWLTCTLCPLHQYRHKVVLGRGAVPADIMFVGLGPGRTENLLGQPFVGESGHLLETALHDAVLKANTPLARMPAIYFTNVVACRPCNASQGPDSKNRDPTNDEAWACWPRLKRTYELVRPRLVVLLGKTTCRLYGKQWPNILELDHPAYLVRQGRTKAPGYAGYVRKLAEALEENYGKNI